MKKLLYIQSRFGQGGINKITSIKENYWVNHGYDVHNLNALNSEKLSPGGMYDERIKMHYISGNRLSRLARIVIIGRLLRFFYYRIKMLSIILRINPDVIIVTMPFLEPATVVWLTFWKMRILEFHGWYCNPAPRKMTIKERITFKIIFPFYKIVTLTKGEAEKMEHITGNNATFIPNPQYSFPTVASNCEKKRVVSMARFTFPKNLDAVLPYWSIIEDKHPDWELHLYGEGPDEPKMVEAIKDNNLKTVFIHPYTSKVIEEMTNSSIYILPSVFEGFGLALLESMSVGVPCVAYDCPFGPSEIINDGEDGFVTEYMNPKAMMEKVLYLIEHDDIRKEMGKKARENSLKSFNIDSIMAQWIKIFNSK